MTIAIGMLIDREGFCRRSKVVASSAPGTFDVHHVHSLEAVRLRPLQRAVGIDLGHDHSRRIGALVHLEEDGRGSTWAVADVEEDKLPPGPLLYSSQDLGPDHAAELVGIAVTARPAMTGLPPCACCPSAATPSARRTPCGLPRPSRSSARCWSGPGWQCAGAATGTGRSCAQAGAAAAAPGGRRLPGGRRAGRRPAAQQRRPDGAR